MYLVQYIFTLGNVSLFYNSEDLKWNVINSSHLKNVKDKYYINNLFLNLNIVYIYIYRS